MSKMFEPWLDEATGEIVFGSSSSEDELEQELRRLASTWHSHHISTHGQPGLLKRLLLTICGRDTGMFICMRQTCLMKRAKTTYALVCGRYHLYTLTLPKVQSYK